MKGIKKNLRIVFILLIAMFVVLGLYFAYAVTTYGTRWFTNPYNSRLNAQKSSVTPGDILDRNREVLASTDADGERQYSSSSATRKAVSHVVGDSYGLTSGAESFFAQYLLGFNTNLFERVYEGFTGQSARGDDILLTIDAQLCKYIESAMGDYKGSVVVMNYKTGEILASVSRPGFNPENMDAYRAATDEEKRQGEDDGDTSALVNRATMGRYTPGSVFKIVTAAAALRYMGDATTRTWDCFGPLAFDSATGVLDKNLRLSEEQDKALRQGGDSGDKLLDENAPETQAGGASPSPSPKPANEHVYLRDYQSDYHGEIDLETAFAKSCNHTFAEIALELGGAKMTRIAQAFGFGENFMFADTVLYSSSYDPGSSPYRLGWSAVGQHLDMVTPMHMCMITASIANDGVMMAPKLLKGVLNSREYVINSVLPTEYSRPLTAAEAATLTEYMAQCVKRGTGKSAAHSKYQVCGKTGTAEVSSSASVGNHAWFTGFVDDEKHPIAVTVILEHAGSGGGKAGPVAGDVIAKAIKLGH